MRISTGRFANARSAIFVTGPATGAANVANAYLEGTYSELYPDIGQDAAGMIMREHQLERTESLTYAEMGRFIAAKNPDDPAGDERRGSGVEGRGGQRDLEPRPAELGHGGRDHDTPQHELHGRAARDLRHGGRGSLCC